MPRHDAEDIASILRRSHHGRDRLILAVGPSGCGKTAWLRRAAAAHRLHYVSLGQPLAGAIANVTPRHRPIALARTLDHILPSGDGGLCLDNLDVLFLPELQCDPLRLVAQLSQYRLVLAGFTAQFFDGRFTRAYPDHPEYLSRVLSGVTVASLSSGDQTFFQT